MVIAALATPDHSTIAEFRRRHERALAELFTGVLGLCRKAGLVQVGLLAVDGMKLRARTPRSTPTVTMSGSRRSCWRTLSGSTARRMSGSARTSVVMRRPVSTLRGGSGWRFAVKRFALGLLGRVFGDGGTGHPLGGCEVEPVARRAGDCDRDVLLQAAVAGWVVGRAVLPAAPDDAAPGASERADRALVVVAARSRAGVVVSRPGVPVAGAVSERVERAA